MNLIEKLEFGYYNQDWTAIADALKLLGVETKPQIKEKVASKPPTKAKVQKTEVSTTVDIEQFNVSNRGKSKDMWEEISTKHYNTFVDTKEDMKSGSYKPDYPKGKRPKGVKAEYPSYEAYLQDVMYKKQSTNKNRRPPSTKVKMTCAKCHETSEVYPSQIVYSSLEDKKWLCNACNGL